MGGGSVFLRGIWLSIESGSLQGGASGKEPACNAGDARDAGSIPRPKRSPGGGHGNPLQYSCLEKPRNRGAWRAIVSP